MVDCLFCSYRSLVDTRERYQSRAAQSMQLSPAAAVEGTVGTALLRGAFLFVPTFQHHQRTEQQPAATQQQHVCEVCLF